MSTVKREKTKVVCFPTREVSLQALLFQLMYSREATLGAQTKMAETSSARDTLLVFEGRGAPLGQLATHSFFYHMICKWLQLQNIECKRRTKYANPRYRRAKLDLTLEGRRNYQNSGEYYNQPSSVELSTFETVSGQNGHKLCK